MNNLFRFLKNEKKKKKIENNNVIKWILRRTINGKLVISNFGISIRFCDANINVIIKKNGERKY